MVKKLVLLTNERKSCPQTSCKIENILCFMPEIENILVFPDFLRIILPPHHIAVTLHQIQLKTSPLQLTQTGEKGKRKRAPQRLRN